MFATVFFLFFFLVGSELSKSAVKGAVAHGDYFF